MTWFTRTDRFADTHLVYSQEETMSCGLASSKMIVFKVNKLKPGASASVTEAKVESIYRRYCPGTAKVGDEGVLFEQMHKVLNELNIGTWAHAAPPNHEIPALLIQKLKPDILGVPLANAILRDSPVMLRVQWGGGDAHAVVCDTVTRIPGFDTYYAAICDPADGDVHITDVTLGEQIAYQGRRVTYSMNFWGRAAENYGRYQNNAGVVTDIIYRTA